MSDVDKGMVLEPGEPNEPLHDDALRKALAQAPDRGTLPDWRVRQAILDHAHDAISASEELLTASRERAPWWRLAWWRDKVGLSGATPWNAALASLMVAVLVTLIWQREPVPGARPDDETALTSAPAPAAAPEAAPTFKEEAAKAAAKETAKETSAKKDASKGAGSKETGAKDAAAKEAAAKEVAAKEARETAAREAAAKEMAAREAAAKEAAAKKADSSRPVPAAPAASQPRESKPESAPAVAAMRTPAPQEAIAGADSAARASAPSFAAAPPPPARTAPSTAPPPSTADASAERRKSAPAAAAAPSTRSDVVPMSDFSSLSRWTELRVANVNGDVRVVPRAEAGDLGLLMSSAAIMAVGATPLRSLPEWRVSLERRGQVLAVLEVARNDVRWTEGALPPAAGTPPPEALEALRGALRQAIRSGAAARPLPAQPAAKAPGAESPSGRLPYSPLAPPVLPSTEAPAPPADAPRAPE